MIVTRRTYLLTGTAFGLMQGVPVNAQIRPSIHVVKDAGCPCCNAWIGHVRDAGFPVTFDERSIEALELYKREMGVPEDLASCHTATVEGYVLEGHVPAADISRLLIERPEAAGLAVPGMPYGSPGMGPEAKREAYDVILIGKDGSASTFTSYAAT